MQDIPARRLSRADYAGVFVMALRTSKLSTATVIAALLSMTATPVAAMDLPKAGPTTVHAYDADAVNVNRSRRHHYRDRVDAGDIIAGVLILGGIAAIASAANKPREPQVRYPDRYPERYPDSGPRYAQTGRAGGQGMERAVDICVDAVERQQGRVASVDGANRTGEGWQVSGDLARGEGYSCWIGNDGQVNGVEVYGADRGYQRDDGYEGGSYDGSAYQPADDRQWDDESYARARAAVGSPPPYQTAQASGH
jgi:hypothetical protein